MHHENEFASTERPIEPEDNPEAIEALLQVMQKTLTGFVGEVSKQQSVFEKHKISPASLTTTVCAKVTAELMISSFDFSQISTDEVISDYSRLLKDYLAILLIEDLENA